MGINSSPLFKLINSLQKLPSIGPRSAERLAYFMLKMPNEEVFSLAEALTDLKNKVHFCKDCFNITSEELCDICGDPVRDRAIIMVVEEPLDVLALEKTGKYKGIYHVLGGVVDPIKGIGVEEIRVKELLDRLRTLARDDEALEIILATNPSTEGETTAVYIKKLIENENLGEKIRVTRIARGLPIGADLEYADPMTLMRSLEGRRDY
jgi:recombination protein RecR